MTNQLTCPLCKDPVKAERPEGLRTWRIHCTKCGRLLDLQPNKEQAEWIWRNTMHLTAPVAVASSRGAMPKTYEEARRAEEAKREAAAAKRERKY